MNVGRRNKAPHPALIDDSRTGPAALDNLA
jgi:hypothetical protein